MEIEDIIKKDFDFANNLVEIENIENSNSDDFVYVVEVNDYDKNKYSTYCNQWCNLLSNLLGNLQNRNIEEIDNVDDNDKLPCQDIIELYENHNNCKLYFFKEEKK